MFSLAWPWMLCILPLPWLARWVLPAVKTEQAFGLKVPFFSRFLQASESATAWNYSYFTFKQLLPFIIWLLLILAVSRPEWLGEPTQLPRAGRDIMMAIDLSGSMQIPDMTLNSEQVNRLAVVKNVAANFIDQRKGDRLGLVLFGSKAYLQTPLTFDRQTVNTMLDDATIGLAGTQTAIGDAIGLAVKQLLNYPEQSRILILLTDGMNNTGTIDPLQAAKIAEQAKVKIYTIGIGAEKLLVPGLFGPEVVDPSRDLDETTLQAIAEKTGGVYFRAKDTAALKTVYKKIDALEPVSTDASYFRPIKALYPWPLGLAFILSIWLAAQRCFLHFRTSTA